MYPYRKENFTLYEKRGRRYYPVSEYDNKVMDSFPKGFCLVHCQPGSTSFRYHVTPDCIQVEAACQLMEDAMADAMREESKFRPTRKAITPRQRAAYDAYAKECGDDIYLLQAESSFKIIQAGLDVLRKHIKEQASEQTD